jgi:hypothetical protein
MIVIRVELWSAITGQKTELARMVIDNIGGTSTLGNYRVRTLRGRCAAALDRSMAKIATTGTQREGRVISYPRERVHVWNLVAKALTTIGYGEYGDAA